MLLETLSAYHAWCPPSVFDLPQTVKKKESDEMKTREHDVSSEKSDSNQCLALA